MKKITTYSGSVYLLDEDAKAVQRVAGDGANILRKDGEIVPLLEIITLEEGVMMELVLDIRGDGIKTYRRTTSIQTIEEIDLS